MGVHARRRGPKRVQGKGNIISRMMRSVSKYRSGLICTRPICVSPSTKDREVAVATATDGGAPSTVCDGPPPRAGEELVSTSTPSGGKGLGGRGICPLAWQEAQFKNHGAQTVAQGGVGGFERIKIGQFGVAILFQCLADLVPACVRAIEF